MRRKRDRVDLALNSCHQASFLAAVPSVVAFMESVPAAVKHVDVAGEALTHVVVDQLCLDVCLYNYFGPRLVADC